MEKLAYVFGFLLIAFLITGFQKVLNAVPEVLAHFFHGTPIQTLAGGSLVLLLGYFSGWLSKTSEYDLSKVPYRTDSSMSFKITWGVLSALVLGYGGYQALDWSQRDLFRVLLSGAPRFSALCFFWILCVFIPAKRIHELAETRRRHGAGTD